jgi:threonine dehydrogenase-like Zn-dependent dehydrogenase
MRALVWDGSQARVVPDAPQPGLLPGTALVRVRLAGICSTDLQILAGYMGFRGILGHEFVGEVVEGPNELRGRRVVGEINFACRRCPTCASGRTRHCPTRTVLGILGADGAFAEFVRLPVVNLHRVPDRVGDQQAVFVEPLAAAFQGAEQTASLQGGRSAVIGAGKLGLLIAQVLATRGDHVVLVCRGQASLERLEARLETVMRRLDIERSSVASVGRGFDLVVEATGDQAGLALAVELVKPQGAILLKSTVAGQHTLDLAPLVINEVRVIGSRCGAFAPAIQALAEETISVSPLIDAELPLSDGIEALRRAGAPGALKLLLEPSA